MKRIELTLGLMMLVGAVSARAQEVSEKAAPIIRADKAGIQWVSIPGGTFMMGLRNGGKTADADLRRAEADEKPAHSVTIKSFQIAKTLVTNKQYKVCVADGACTEPVFMGPFGADDQPVVGVDWNQAKSFSEWAGGRLPTEAEWEYAARSSGKDQKYPWGDEEATCERAVIDGCGYRCGSGGATAPVCSKPSGKAPSRLLWKIEKRNLWLSS
jgi:formylglycine-generating enzyme required for sulfatase activity